MRKLWYWILCKLGRPSCYQDFQDDGSWWFAMCKSCNRQAEVHEFGGPHPRKVAERFSNG